MLQMFIAVINENFEVSEEAKESKQASHYWAMHEPAGERTPEWIKKLNPYRWLKAQKERPHQRDRREEHESYISRPFHRLSMVMFHPYPTFFLLIAFRGIHSLNPANRVITQVNP
jgi:hypothetical protein